MIQFIWEVTNLEIYLVTKQSISGWSREIVTAFENIKEAESFIIGKKTVQYEYKIQRITLVRTNHS